MNCPNCNYEPEINDLDYCDGPGRFYTIALEMKQEPNPYSKYDVRREPLLGCPLCGTVFINMGYVNENQNRN